MSFDSTKQSVSLEAAADLSAKQYRAIAVNSSGKAAVAGATDYVVGILQNNPAAGQAASVSFSGVSKAKLGGTVAAGARVTSDANGAIIAATTGDSAIGIALIGGVSGDIASVLIGVTGALAVAAVS